MQIGKRLLTLRRAKKLSQGDIEKRTGLKRCYTSRVENGHTVPAIETLEKYAHVLEIPLYRFFYEGDRSPRAKVSIPEPSEDGWGTAGRERGELLKFTKLLSKLNERERRILFDTAIRMIGQSRSAN